MWKLYLRLGWWYIPKPVRAVLFLPVIFMAIICCGIAKLAEMIAYLPQTFKELVLDNKRRQEAIDYHKMVIRWHRKNKEVKNK